MSFDIDLLRSLDGDTLLFYIYKVSPDVLDEVNAWSEERKLACESKLEKLHKMPHLPLSAEEFMDLYNLFCPSLPKCLKLTKERREKIKLRLKAYPDRNFWIEVFKKANSVFVPPTRMCPCGWRPDITFIIRNDENPLKIFEGKYPTKRPAHRQIGAESLLSKLDGESLPK